MYKINIKIKTSISLLFSSIILLVVGILMYFQFNSNIEFAQITTQKVFTIISDNVVKKIDDYDSESKQFLDLLKKVKNIDESPSLDEKHIIFDVMAEHIKNSNYVYATYIGFKNDTFYELINLNLSSSIKKYLKAPSNSRWLIIKHIKIDNTITRYEEFLDENLKKVSLKIKTTSYETSKRPWYKEAMNSDRSIKTNTYFFATLKQYGVTYAEAVNKNKGTVLGLDISLKSLNALLKEQKLVKGSASFIFKKNGDVLGEFDNISNKSIENLSELYPDVFIKDNKILDLEKQVLVNVNGNKYIKYTTLLESKFDSKDYLTILSPYDEIMKPYKRKVFEAIGITILILILFVFPIVFFAIDLIVRPILSLEKENEKIAKGKFKKVKGVPSFMIEISSLSRSLVSMAASIEDLTNNLEKKIKQRTKEVEVKNKNIANLLNNAGQGFLYFNRDMIVGNEISKETKRIFNKNIVGKNLINLLFDEEEDRELIISTLLYILDQDDDKREVLISLLQKEFVINDSYINFEYKVLNKDRFMLILTDITSKKELDQQIKDEQQILKMVVEAVSSIEQFKDLKSGYELMISNIEELKTLDNLKSLRMEIHTYKGLFAQKNMINIVKKLHDFESLIDTSLKTNKLSSTIEEINQEEMQSWLDEDIEVLKSILGSGYFNSENRISIKKDRISNIAKNISSLKEKVSEYQQKDKSSTKVSETFDKLISSVNNLCNRNIHVYLQPYKSLVEDLAMKLEKPLNALEINLNEDIYLNDSYKGFLTSLVHIFRNSVDHGIETIERREELEKELFGTIQVNIHTKDKKLFVSISDDGKGIDLNIIKKLALERNIYTQEELDNLSEQEALLIVFKDSFSTSETISDISGRGVGLASILHELNKIDGNLHIENEVGKGVNFMFTLPLIS